MNSAAVNQAYMMRTGLTYSGQRLWTVEEIKTLKRLYPDYKALVLALPERTRSAIEAKAWRCRIARPLRVWSEAEFAIMKPLYIRGEPMPMILTRLPNKTARQVWAKAWNRNIQRPRRPPQSTGLATVDAIRRRAFDLHFSMVDLDIMASRRGYFKYPRRTDWSAIQRVLPHIGGRIAVLWHEN